MAKRTYFACKMDQRASGGAVKLAVFAARAKDIASWAGIRRVGEDEAGVQRVVKPAKIRSIRRFFAKDPRNTIPTSITLAFNPGTVSFEPDQGVGTKGDERFAEWGRIHFEFEPGEPEKRRPALIVDGQHRLLAMAELEENPPLFVVALLNAELQEQAFQFVVINRKAGKVPTQNVKAIIADIDEEELQNRLLEAGVNYGQASVILKEINELEESPFQGILDWPLNPKEDRVVPLTTIDSCLRYIRRRFMDLEEDDDSLRDFFLAIWRTVADHYPELWNTSDVFMKKINLTALNEYIADRLETPWIDGDLDVFEIEQVAKRTERAIRLIPSDFWRQEWTSKLQDNALVRRTIKEDLQQIARNARSRDTEWHHRLKLVGKVMQP